MTNLKISELYPLSQIGGGTGSSDFSTVTTTTTLTSGGFYTINPSSSTEINIGSIGSNSNCAFKNEGSQIVVISGLTQIGATTIPANKGLKMGDTSSLWLTKNGATTAVAILGSYTLSWIPGYVSPLVECIYSTNGDANGIIYYFGSSGRSTLYSNPYPSIISIQDTNQLYGGVGKYQMTDRSPVWGSTIGYANGTGTQTITFPSPVKVNRFSVRNRDYTDNAATVFFSYFYEGSWISVPQLTHSTRSDDPLIYTVSAQYEIPNFTTQVQLTFSGRGGCHDDIEFYGYINPS